MSKKTGVTARPHVMLSLIKHPGRGVEVVRVSFDSNAWEVIFAPGDTAYSPIRVALRDRKIEGFICAAGFRIEAITKRNRPSYFAQPHMAVTVDVKPGEKDGLFHVFMSMGPDDSKHPGLPLVQAEKLRHALNAGIKLMCGENWMGLPVPAEIRDKEVYVFEDAEATRERESRQLAASAAIEERGVGKAAFDAVDGWTDRPRTPAEEKELIRACAEWADGELVAAHIAYQNDILCTNDRARSAGQSIFNTANRAWLVSSYGVACLTLDELAASVSLQTISR